MLTALFAGAIRVLVSARARMSASVAVIIFVIFIFVSLLFCFTVFYSCRRDPFPYESLMLMLVCVGVFWQF